MKDENEKTYGNPYVFFRLNMLFTLFAVLAGGYPNKFVKLAAEVFGIVIAAHFGYLGNIVGSIS